MMRNELAIAFAKQIYFELLTMNDYDRKLITAAMTSWISSIMKRRKFK